jgi:hypothetical protein
VAYPQHPAPPPRAEYSVLAVFSFVLSLCGGFVLGLAISGLWVAVIAAVLITGLVDQAGRDAAGNIRTEGDVVLADLRVGDCVAGLQSGNKVIKVTGVLCDFPHQGEVVAVFNLEGDAWPGQNAMTEQAEAGCATRFKKYAPEEYDSLELVYFSPEKQTWTLDRSVICIAIDPKGDLKGSLGE